MYLRVKLNKPSSSEEGCRLRALPRAPGHIYIGEWLFKGSWKLICPKNVVFFADGLKSLEELSLCSTATLANQKDLQRNSSRRGLEAACSTSQDCRAQTSIWSDCCSHWLGCVAGRGLGGGTLASILWKSMFFFPFRNNPASARSTCNSQSSLTASCFFSAEQSLRKRCCPCTDLGLRSHQSWLILV